MCVVGGRNERPQDPIGNAARLKQRLRSLCASLFWELSPTLCTYVRTYLGNYLVYLVVVVAAAVVAVREEGGGGGGKYLV